MTDKKDNIRSGTALRIIVESQSVPGPSLLPPQNGELIDNGRRWCEACGHAHGPLYCCPHYPPQVAAEVLSDEARFLRNLSDPLWRERQVQSGVPPVVLAILDALAGRR